MFTFQEYFSSWFLLAEVFLKADVIVAYGHIQGTQI